ncbi:sigma 54-interacting transcriptional regulator, partial [Campylobacter coli]|uniref:sigma 54-interacting transcriptional regulator n=1 Tax=Campylobacter coli TaxID=195 RepID=UPI000A6BEE84
VFSRFIHENSKRSQKSVVAINMAAIPSNLIESELFGFEKGAFTDANATKIGLFEMANNGTLFLDEIGEMPYEIQAKLLRALQE